MIPGRLDHVRDIITDEVRADPVTQALIGPITQAVTAALDAHHPRLTRTTEEAAGMLGLGQGSVLAMVADGRLHRIAGPLSPITLVSILGAAGWPTAPAPLAAPLSVVPGGEA